MASARRSKRVTLAQVAEAAGVSVMTASYTYNRPSRVSLDARERVLAAAARLGYAGPDPAARSLRRGSTRTLGVVLGEHLSYAFEDPQAATFLAGIADVCAEHGYGMTILPITGAADDPARIRAAAVDGFVVWTTDEDDPVLTAVRQVRRPAVVHGGPAVPRLGLVGIDNRAAARAVGAAAFAGASRPAVVSFPLSRHRTTTIARGTDPATATFPVTRDRLAGYRDAATDAGIPWSDVQVAVCARNDATEAEGITATLLTGPTTEAGGTAKAGEKAGASEKAGAGKRRQAPDAIAAMSDEQATGVLRAIHAAGLAVPKDVSVTGWDDGPAATAHDLTTVAQSLREQGAACAQAVLGNQLTRVSSPWSVVRRGTTR
jgi:DNA-binding LacI/PurR family transcriptional regulator